VIFVDTSFWIALQLPRERHHGEAVALMRELADASLVTSNHVRGESWTMLRQRAWHAAAVAFLDVLERTERVRIERVPRDAEEAALRWLRQHGEREYSYVDATSFALMRSLRITEALAFDGDFAAAGFVELRA
jgi:predicted nucleic acid-binding protein